MKKDHLNQPQEPVVLFEKTTTQRMKEKIGMRVALREVACNVVALREVVAPKAVVRKPE